MPEDNYHRRLVDAIVDTSGAASRSVRDEYLMVLTRLLGESPQVSRSADPRTDVAAIVAWCADRPGGLTKLVDAVATIEESSAAVDRLRSRLSIGKPVELLQDDERALVVNRLSGMDQASIMLLLRDVASRWGPRLRPAADDAQNIVELLEDSIANADEPHPLNVVLARLARLVGSSELDDLAGMVSHRTGTRGANPLDLPPPTGGHYFVVRLMHDGRDASRYLITVWLTSGDGRWEVRHTSDDPQSLEELQAEIDEQLVRLADDPTVDLGDLFIEFIVPQSLLGADLDQWVVTAPGYSNPIGVHYPVGVRDLPRMRNRLIRSRWRRRCEWIGAHGHVPGGAHFENLNGDRQGNFAEFLQDPEKVCVVVIGPAATYVIGNVNAWLSAGIPVLVWCRENSVSERFHSHMRGILDEGGIHTLPAAVWRLRQDAARSGAAANHVGRHITLLWDFVHRLPPDDQRPLLGPATVNG